MPQIAVNAYRKTRTTPRLYSTQFGTQIMSLNQLKQRAFCCRHTSKSTVDSVLLYTFFLIDKIKVKTKGIKCLRGKAPNTPNSTCAELVAADLTAATEKLAPRAARIDLGRTPVEGAGETTNVGLMSIKAI